MCQPRCRRTSGTSSKPARGHQDTALGWGAKLWKIPHKPARNSFEISERAAWEMVLSYRAQGCVWFPNSEITLCEWDGLLNPKTSPSVPYQMHPDRIKPCLIAYNSSWAHPIHLPLGSEGESCVTHAVMTGRHWAFGTTSAGLTGFAHSHFVSRLFSRYFITSASSESENLWVIFRYMSLAWVLPKSTTQRSGD